MQQTCAKRVQDKTQLGEEVNPLGTVQETEIWPLYQMVYAQTIIRTGKWEAWNYLEFLDTKRNLILAWRLDW